MRDFATSGSCFLEIEEGRATLFAPKAIDERSLQLKRESLQTFTKFERKCERTKVEKRRRGARAKTNERKRSKGSILYTTPDCPPPAAKYWYYCNSIWYFQERKIC